VRFWLIYLLAHANKISNRFYCCVSNLLLLPRQQFTVIAASAIYCYCRVSNLLLLLRQQFTVVAASAICCCCCVSNLLLLLRQQFAVIAASAICCYCCVSNLLLLLRQQFTVIAASATGWTMRRPFPFICSKLVEALHFTPDMYRPHQERVVCCNVFVVTMNSYCFVTTRLLFHQDGQGQDRGHGRHQRVLFYQNAV